MFLPVEVVGVRIEMPSNQPLVLLRESNGGRILPIWIGGVEATAIAMAQQNIESTRPLSHDLMREILEATGTFLTSIHITGVRDGIFFAELNLRTDEGVLPSISARPSDAIALALRTKSNILVAAELFDQMSLDTAPADGSESAVEAFREFLENVDPEDFTA